MFTFMPEQASTWAAYVDWVNNFITDIAVFCILAITGVMIYFAIRYRRRSDNDKTPYITHSASLETAWTVIPSVICIFVFYYGMDSYREMRTPPPNAMEVNVSGVQWRWDFEYSNGKRTTNELVVPVGKPVKLIMRSQDVTHSFYIPAMRVKEDVLASIYTQLWFTPTKLGTYHIFCAEYCGLQHSGMRGRLRVVTEGEFGDFLYERIDPAAIEVPPAERGKMLFAEKGCAACHTVDGSKGLGPSLQGVMGKERVMSDGTKLVADENYIQESILNSQEKIVQGFEGIVMPAFAGQLSPAEVDSLIAYLKTL